MNQCNRIQKAYDKAATKLVSEWGERNSQHHDRLDLFSSFLNQGDKLLDVGCGFGRDVAYFSEKGFVSRGIDISNSMIELGIERYGDIDIFKSDFFNYLGTCLQKYDGIWVRGVLFHYKYLDVYRFANVLKGAMKEGALIYIQSSNKKGKCNKNISNTQETLTYYFHSRSDYVDIFKRNGCILLKDISTDHDICLIFRFDNQGIE